MVLSEAIFICLLLFLTFKSLQGSCGMASTLNLTSKYILFDPTNFILIKLINKYKAEIYIKLWIDIQITLIRPWDKIVSVKLFLI